MKISHTKNLRAKKNWKLIWEDIGSGICHRASASGFFLARLVPAYVTSRECDLGYLGTSYKNIDLNQSNRLLVSKWVPPSMIDMNFFVSVFVSCNL